MLKVRLMGTRNDIKWFGKILQRNPVIPHIQDSDMVELAGQVLEKPEAMSDEEFAQVALEAPE